MHWENLRLPVSFKIMLDQHFLKMTEQLHFLSIDLNRCLFDIERLGHLMSGGPSFHFIFGWLHHLFPDVSVGLPSD